MSMSYNDALARLHDERTALAMSQKDMSIRLQMVQSHYSKIERGLNRFNFHELKRLGDNGIDINYIFTGRRYSGKHYDFFKDMSFDELACLFNILCELVLWLYRYGSGDCRDAELCGRLDFLGYVNQSMRSSKNVFVAIRQYYSFTQLEMADLMMVDVKKLRDFENGRLLPDSEILMRMYDRFGMIPSMLLRDARGMAAQICDVLQTVEEQYSSNVYKYIEVIHMLFKAEKRV